jgi:cyclopropane fatty-acyl-phospholipid synthase-like methyltransferase
MHLSGLSNKTSLALQVLVLRFLNCIGFTNSPFYYPVSATLKELGRRGCSELYSIERSFHGLILAETSYNERCGLYARLTNSIKSCKAKYTSAKAFGWNPGLLEDWINLFSQKDVLDYGCGYGGSRFFLGKVANSVTGVDSAEACISHCLQVKSAQLVENILFFSVIRSPHQI